MSPRILIVDDDSDVRAILSLRLTGAGFEVATAADGREGLAALYQATPSGIVLDLLMPNVSGFDFLIALREAHPSPPPVFVVSELDDDLVREHVRALGAERLVSKGDALGREFAQSLARRLGHAGSLSSPPSHDRVPVGELQLGGP